MRYTSKQDVVNKGIIKKDGKIQKLSILEIWYSKGYLELPKSKYTADECLKCWLKLALDYQIINRANLHSGYIENTRIDKSKNLQSTSLLDVMNRYNKAIKSAPKEFWHVVRRICIDDCDIIFSKNISERQRAYLSYLSRIDLCRGLDRIIEAYTKKLS